MHQITAFDGLPGKAPFNAAVIQSPGFQDVPGKLLQEQSFDELLSLLNVSTLQEARQLPSSALVEVNLQQVAASPYSLFTYGPVVDGLFAPGIPGKLLLQGSFDHELKLILGHNANEGLASTSAQQHAQHIRVYLCFSQPNIPLSLQGQDIPYTFLNGPNTAVLSDATALASQAYITSFAETGTPNGPGISSFPLYGNDSFILKRKATSITEIMDSSANERCLWWQKALYY
ncbi:MAG: hypothetical protein Q9184_001722 [Pyrenodesmia sp. 2 TL-2023]